MEVAKSGVAEAARELVTMAPTSPLPSRSDSLPDEEKNDCKKKS